MFWKSVPAIVPKAADPKVVKKRLSFAKKALAGLGKHKARRASTFSQPNCNEISGGTHCQDSPHDEPFNEGDSAAAAREPSKRCRLLGPYLSRMSRGQS